MWGGLAAVTVGGVLIGCSQSIEHDKDSFILLSSAIGAATIGAGMAAGGGALYHGGRRMMRDADAGQLGPEFQLNVAPAGYANGGGINLAGSF
jgi:hypothetical protein